MKDQLQDAKIQIKSCENIMSKYVIFAMILLLTACGEKTFYNPNPEADWNRDSSQCEAYALGNSPMPQYQAIQGSQQIYGTGMIGSDIYTYSGTIYPDNTQAQLNNIGASLGAMAQHQRLYEICLRSLGWIEQEGSFKEREQGEKNHRYEACIKERAWRMTDTYSDMSSLVQSVESICRERTGAYVKGFAAYYARKALDNPGQPPE